MALQTNVVIVAGRVSRDAETKEFNNGGKIVSFDIGFLESTYKDNKSGKWVYKNGFVTVKKNFSAEANADYVANLAKGMHVVIQGKLGFEQWGEGQAKRSRVVLVADKISTLDAPTGSESASRKEQKRGSGGNRDGGYPDYDAPDPDADEGGDIPF